METEQATTNADLTAALTLDFSRTAAGLFAAGSVEDTLSAVVNLAVATIEGCDFAGVFLLRGDVITTPAHTAAIVTEVDAMQQRTSQGPCLDAIRAGVTFYADDLAEEPRWPAFGIEARAAGIRSILALPLIGDGAVGALNLYASYPRAFGVIDRARGLLLAALATLAFTAAQNHEDAEKRVANLHAALESREVIGQAQGILMEREHITANQAFDMLRRASQHLNLKLREVAQVLVETGERPRTGSRPKPPEHPAH